MNQTARLSTSGSETHVCYLEAVRLAEQCETAGTFRALDDSASSLLKCDAINVLKWWPRSLVGMDTRQFITRVGLRKGRGEAQSYASEVLNQLKRTLPPSTTKKLTSVIIVDNNLGLHLTAGLAPVGGNCSFLHFFPFIFFTFFTYIGNVLARYL